jgi:chromate transporter
VREYLELFWAFIIIGGTAFGGGYAAVPLLEREMIKKRGWLTMEEVLDFYTIAQITPAISLVNVGTFVGCKRNGIPGGNIATIGIILPGVSLMLLISLFIRRFAEYPAVQRAFSGIRLAVCALILDTTIKLFKGFWKDHKAMIISVIAFILSAIFSVSPVYIIPVAGLAGFLLFSPKGKGG